MSFAILTDYDLTGPRRIIAYATNEWIIPVVNEAGDPFDFTPYDSIRAALRDQEENSELPESQVADVVIDVPYSATDIYPQTMCAFVLPKTSGLVRLVIGAAETKIEQDLEADARGSGLYDILAFTAASGVANSLQAKVVKGRWEIEWTATRQSP